MTPSQPAAALKLLLCTLSGLRAPSRPEWGQRWGWLGLGPHAQWTAPADGWGVSQTKESQAWRRFLVQPPEGQPGKVAETPGLEQSGDTARAWPALGGGSAECGRARGTANMLPGPKRGPLSYAIAEPMQTPAAGAEGSVAVSAPGPRKVPSSPRPQTPTLTDRRGGILDLQGVGLAHGQRPMLRVGIHPLSGEDGHLRQIREVPHGPGLGLGPLPGDSQHPHGTPSPLQLPQNGPPTGRSPPVTPHPRHSPWAAAPPGRTASWQVAECLGAKCWGSSIQRTQQP